jgi:hypothetical protein
MPPVYLDVFPTLRRGERRGEEQRELSQQLSSWLAENVQAVQAVRKSKEEGKESEQLTSTSSSSSVKPIFSSSSPFQLFLNDLPLPTRSSLESESKAPLLSTTPPLSFFQLHAARPFEVASSSSEDERRGGDFISRLTRKALAFPTKVEDFNRQTETVKRKFKEEKKQQQAKWEMKQRQQRDQQQAWDETHTTSTSSLHSSSSSSSSRESQRGLPDWLPIILVPSIQSQSLIHRGSAASFLNASFESNGQLSLDRAPPRKLKIEHTIKGQPMTFLVADQSIFSSRETEWHLRNFRDRIVAIFIDGTLRQFNTYPIQEPASIFQKALGVHVCYQEEQQHRNVSRPLSMTVVDKFSRNSYTASMASSFLKQSEKEKKERHQQQQQGSARRMENEEDDSDEEEEKKADMELAQQHLEQKRQELAERRAKVGRSQPGNRRNQLDTSNPVENIAKWKVEVFTLSKTMVHFNVASSSRFWDSLEKFLEREKPEIIRYAHERARRASKSKKQTPFSAPNPSSKRRREEEGNQPSFLANKKITSSVRAT